MADALDAWMKAGNYLPDVLRDFHDQKDVFKAMHDMQKPADPMDVISGAYSLSFVTGQCYVIDRFLWFMARRGYTLQRSRTSLPFRDLQADVRAATEKRNAADMALLTPHLGVTVPATPQPKLTVWYGSMPESNGRTNWTAILHKGDMSEGHTIDRSQYPGRVRYAADRVRWLLGELDKEPWILDYDGDERTPCHLCGGSGEKDGKPCWGLNFEGTVHDAASGVAAGAPDDDLEAFMREEFARTMRGEDTPLRRWALEVKADRERAPGVSVVDHQTISEQTPAKGNPTS